jgi:hypothetical protein
MGQFAVAALYERRNLLNQNPAGIDRRYKQTKVHHYLEQRELELVKLTLGGRTLATIRDLA